jgi:hypothetical protein
MIFMMMYFYSSPAPAQTGGGGGMGSSALQSPRQLYNAKMEREHHALDVLNATRWGDFAVAGEGIGREMGMPGRWINLTGFREEDGHAWGKLEWAERSFEGLQREVGKGVVFANVTGILKGRWVRDGKLRTGQNLNLTELAPEVNWASREWSRNITGSEGKTILRIEDNYVEVDMDGLPVKGVDLEAAREVSATLTLQDESSWGDGWDMRLHGVHWPKNGKLVMTTTSEKFAGIYGLPHLTASRSEFNDTQRVLNKTLGDALRKKEKSIWMDMNDQFSSGGMMPSPHCEYVAYVQIHPIQKKDLGIDFDDSSVSLKTIMQSIENEMRYPTGAPDSKPPSLRASFVVFSPDCGFVLESKGPPKYEAAEGLQLRGYKHEEFMARVKSWVLLWTATIFGQVLLLVSQMKEASTPSTVSRISAYTIGMMFVVDFILFMSLMMFSSAVPAIFPSMTLAGFATAIGVGMGARFLQDINKVQAPERRERERERARERAQITQTTQASQASAGQATVTAPIITAAGADGLPLPATAARPAQITDTPIIMPSDQDIDAEIAQNVANGAAAVPINTQTIRPTATTPTSSDFVSSMGPFILLLTMFFFLTLSSISWPTPLRTFYVNLLATVYLSLWLPQIYRNIMRNCRKAFLWKFVIGQSILRTLPIAYFYLKDDNIIFAETNFVSMAILGAWLWAQVWVLVAQEVLGPRFGLPKGWLPEAWDYHPILSEDDVEGGAMPIGLVRAPGSPGLERRSGEGGKKSDDGSNHVRTVDCAICMNALDVPVMAASIGGEGAGKNSGGVAGMLARRLYMVTPCRHVFHSVCLEGWMRYRLQCPICRESLPPL